MGNKVSNVWNMILSSITLYGFLFGASLLGCTNRLLAVIIIKTQIIFSLEQLWDFFRIDIKKNKKMVCCIVLPANQSNCS